MLKTFSLFLFAFTLSLGLIAKAFDVPALKGPVMDEVNLISPSTKNQIAENLFQIRQQNGPQIQVYITSSLQGESIEQVAIQIFDKWKLGDAKKDDGILFLIAPKEKKMRIEVGQGLEGDLPDVIAKRIVADVVAPFFKRGEFDFGVTQGVAAIGQYLNASPEQKAQVREQVESHKTKGFFGLGNGVIFLIVIGIWILLFIFSPSLALNLLFAIMSGGRGGGSGGRGGGSWSGGGGSSSGGGASGDW